MSGRREEILDAALAVADERGFEAVSMRAVADRVGVTPMALYRHVAGKAELLDGMLGRLLTALLPAEADAAGGDAAGGEGAAGAAGAERPPWNERLGAFAEAFRRVTRRHPWSAQLLFSRPAVTPDAVRVVDLLYTALLEAGVPEREVPRLERMISTFMIGFAASEAAGRFATGGLDPRARRGQLPEGELPGHRRLARWRDEPADLGAEFEADLADILRLIESSAQRGRRSPRGQRGQRKRESDGPSSLR
jgi:AcrR family transcriptional regulator